MNRICRSMPNTILPSVCLVFVLVLPATAATVDNGLLRIGFEDTRGALVTFEDMTSHHKFVDSESTAPLWQIQLMPAEKGVIVPDQATSFRTEPTHTPKGMRLVWEGFQVPETQSLRVSVEVSLDHETPLSQWSIKIEGLGKLRPATVRFPRIGNLTPQESEVLAVPVWMGERTAKARELLSSGGQGRRFEWEYPGLLSMQCVAFYRENGTGFYAAADDTAAYGKRFALFGDGKAGVGFEVVQLPDSGDQGEYVSPYHVTLGTFEGDWVTAAERYRGWALEQTWVRESRLTTGNTADWAVNTGLWVWNRGRSEGVLGPAQILQERAGLPVSVFWHWWHGCPYDVGFPEYLPPREGEYCFRKAMDRAHASGLHAIVYMNQRLWGMTTRSWADEGAERYAVKGQDGKVHPEVYNTFTKSPCASMCMGTEFWRKKYAGLAEQAVCSLGVDGIYMDQACSSLACFDPSHGHPLGGGVYWINGFRLLQADIRTRCNTESRHVVLAGEGCGEAWLPYLDLMLSLQVSMERYAQPGEWEPIPFFHAVYHGYGIFYGNYSSLTMPPYDDLWPAEFAPKEPLKLLDRKFSRQFRLEQARAFVWGQQPTLANFRPELLDERREELDFLIRLAKLRAPNLKYFLYGTFLRAPVLNALEETIDMSRLSIYAGQQGALKEFTKQYPTVIAGAWQASDGDVAVALVNISDSPQDASFSLDAQSCPIPVEGITWISDDNGRREFDRFIQGKATVQTTLAPFQAQLCEFAKP